MTQRDGENWNDWSLREQLAAYVDGELDEARRAQFEKSLQDDPRAYQEFKAQTEFSPANEFFWSQVEPPIPTEGDWSRVAANIDRALAAGVSAEPKRSPRRKRFLLVGLLLASASIAAAVLVAISSGISPAPTHSPIDTGNAEEIFAVLAPHEVRIESVRNADMPLLIVGDSPMQGGVTLASYTDIAFDRIEPDQDGTVPQMHTGSASSMPMAYAPLARAP